MESIDKTCSPADGKETCLADRIPQERDSHEILLNHMLLEQLMAELGDMERRLIELRYFGEKTQIQVAGAGNQPGSGQQTGKTDSAQDAQPGEMTGRSYTVIFIQQ